MNTRNRLKPVHVDCEPEHGPEEGEMVVDGLWTQEPAFQIRIAVDGFHADIVEPVLPKKWSEMGTEHAFVVFRRPLSNGVVGKLVCRQL